MWTILTWVFYPLLAIKYGYNGVALGAALVATSSVVAIYLAQKYLHFSFWSGIKKPLVATIIMGGVVWVLKPFLPGNIFGLISLIIVGGLTYLSCMWLLVGQELILDSKRFLEALKKKK